MNMPIESNSQASIETAQEIFRAVLFSLDMIMSSRSSDICDNVEFVKWTKHSVIHFIERLWNEKLFDKKMLIDIYQLIQTICAKIGKKVNIFLRRKAITSIIKYGTRVSNQGIKFQAAKTEATINFL